MIVLFCMFQTVGFVWGYICQQFSQTILILFAGFVLACLVGTLAVYFHSSSFITVSSKLEISDIDCWTLVKPLDD